MKRWAWALGRDFNTEAFWAGVTAFVWYAFGAVPLHIGVSQQLGITTAETSSWIFIVWFGGAVSSICLSIYYRQPIPVTWTIPGLIYLGTLAGQYSFAELLGANLVAGVLITILGALGVGSHIMRWLPLPIVMGMFGGSILGYVIRLVQATVDDLAVAGVAVAGYLLGRFIGSSRIPPIGLAVTFGAVAIWLGPETATASFGWALPTIGLPPMDFSLSSVLAVALPMVVLAMGLGNVQGLGFLMAQGYQVPINRISTIVGINSIVNALFGGHPATIARTGVAILASPDAGPADRRNWCESRRIRLHCRHGSRRGSPGLPVGHSAPDVHLRAGGPGHSHVLPGCHGEGLRQQAEVWCGSCLWGCSHAFRLRRHHLCLLGCAARGGRVAACREAQPDRLLA